MLAESTEVLWSVLEFAREVRREGGREGEWEGGREGGREEVLSSPSCVSLSVS